MQYSPFTRSLHHWRALPNLHRATKIRALAACFSQLKQHSAVLDSNQSSIVHHLDILAPSLCDSWLPLEIHGPLLKGHKFERKKIGVFFLSFSPVLDPLNV
jgi:hypothetical protein